MWHMVHPCYIFCLGVLVNPPVWCVCIIPQHLPESLLDGSLGVPAEVWYHD